MAIRFKCGPVRKGSPGGGTTEPPAEKRAGRRLLCQAKDRPYSSGVTARDSYFLIVGSGAQLSKRSFVRESYWPIECRIEAVEKTRLLVQQKNVVRGVALVYFSHMNRANWEDYNKFFFECIHAYVPVVRLWPQSSWVRSFPTENNTVASGPEHFYFWGSRRKELLSQFSQLVQCPVAWHDSGTKFFETKAVHVHLRGGATEPACVWDFMTDDRSNI